MGGAQFGKHIHHDGVSDYVDIRSQAQATLSVSGTGADTSALIEGLYDVWSTVDTWIKVDPADASTVTTSTGYILYSGNVVTVAIREGDLLGGITTGGSGTLSYHKVG